MAGPMRLELATSLPCARDILTLNRLGNKSKNHLTRVSALKLPFPPHGFGPGWELLAADDAPRAPRTGVFATARIVPG